MQSVQSKGSKSLLGIWQQFVRSKCAILSCGQGCKVFKVRVQNSYWEYGSKWFEMYHSELWEGMQSVRSKGSKSLLGIWQQFVRSKCTILSCGQGCKVFKVRVQFRIPYWGYSSNLFEVSGTILSWWGWTQNIPSANNISDCLMCYADDWQCFYSQVSRGSRVQTVAVSKLPKKQLSHTHSVILLVIQRLVQQIINS
jgi:hypothetical protein